MHRLFLVAALAACAHDVTAHYPSDGPSGAIDIQLNNPSGALTVAVNDHVMVDRKHSRKAHIDGIPIGDAVVQVAVGGACEQGKTETRTVDVQAGVTSTIVMPGPEPNTPCAIMDGASWVFLGLELVTLGILELGIPKPVSHVK